MPFAVRRLLPAIVVVLAAVIASACSAPAANPPPPSTAPALQGSLNIFAAASLTDAFEEAGRAFTAANPNVTINFNFAGSQQLAAQINEGAPADIFASANGAQMEVALAGGRIDAASVQTFARNQLVVIMPQENPANITSLADLARPGLLLIFADASVPVGQYSRDFLAKASLLPEYSATYSASVLANVVSFEDNVRSVLTKIALGEGDAGIVYTTDAALEGANVQQIAIPAELNTIANYPIAALNDSTNPALAAAFIAFLRSGAGEEILLSYGFLTP